MSFLLILLSVNIALAQFVYEKTNKGCSITRLNVNEVRSSLQQLYGKDCEYLRDSTQVVLGHIFKCPKDQIHSFFRSKEACDLFQQAGPKILPYFAPPHTKDPKIWVSAFGKCMENAPAEKVKGMGLQGLNSFCFCVAGKVTSDITLEIMLECRK